MKIPRIISGLVLVQLWLGRARDARLDFPEIALAASPEPAFEETERL